MQCCRLLNNYTFLKYVKNKNQQSDRSRSCKLKFTLVIFQHYSTHLVHCTCNLGLYRSSPYNSIYVRYVGKSYQCFITDDCFPTYMFCSKSLPGRKMQVPVNLFFSFFHWLNSEICLHLANRYSSLKLDTVPGMFKLRQA